MCYCDAIRPSPVCHKPFTFSTSPQNGIGQLQQNKL